MIFLLFLISVLTYVLYRCIVYFVVANRHLKRMEKANLEYFEHEKEARHTHTHLAGVILIFCCGIMLEFGLFFLFVDMFIFHIPPHPSLSNFLFGVLGLYMVSNAWYIKHVQEEEAGKFDHRAHKASDEK